MDIENFINPNFAYLMLVAGFVLGMLALFSPGTGFLEIGALFAFIIAGWQIYYLPFNWWALVILILGVFPFLLAVRYSKKIIYLVISIIALVIGSVFLFDAEGWKLAVNPILAVVTSTLVAVFFWFTATKSIQAAQLQPSHDLASLIGQVGEARTDLGAEGTVYIAGEMWSARCSQPVKSGAAVRVVERQGLILIVEPVQKD